MTNGAANSIFVDTNVLVSAAIVTAPLNAVARAAIQSHTAVGAQLWTSRQVLREYLAVLSRPQTFTSPLAANVLISDIHDYELRFNIAEDNKAVTDELLSLLAQVPMGGKQIHDANIAATMLVYGIPSILTHNVADFMRFAAYINVIPLA